MHLVWPFRIRYLITLIHSRAETDNMVFGNYEIQRICNIYGTKEYSENTRETLPTTSQTEGEQNKLNQPNKKQKSNPPATKNIYIYTISL